MNENQSENKVEEVSEGNPLFLWRLANSNGVISLLLIAGSLLITLGVIISIIMILRGM